MPRVKHLDKSLLIVILLLICAFFLSRYGLNMMTGFNAVDISIKETTKGAILLNYNTTINLTSKQDITAEFVNTGSSNYTERIEITVYLYNNTSGGLDQKADYYDSLAFLLPGERKSFTTTFLPNRLGIYYIRVKVPYDAKTAELWGSFFVNYVYFQTPQVIFVPISYGGGTIPGQKEVGITSLDLNYKDSLDLYPGQNTLTSIGLNNTGTIGLHNLQFYSTTTENINFEINPKEIFELKQGEYKIFLVSLNLSKGTPPGEYDFSFEVLGLEVRKTGNIKLNVTPLAKKPIKDEVHDTILNYEYLITEIDHEIYLTSIKGFNTSRAEIYLDNAKRNLQNAKDYFNETKYDDAKDMLDRVRRDLENVVFELAAISVNVYIYPAYDPFLVLMLVIMIIIAILILIFLYRRRKKRRPKLIREFTEEET